LINFTEKDLPRPLRRHELSFECQAKRNREKSKFMKKTIKLLSLSLAMLFIHLLAIAKADENILREKSGKKAEKAAISDIITNLRLDFNADWRFHLGEASGFHVPEFDDSSWRTLNTPHDWSIEGQFSKTNPSGASGGYLPGGIGCYRKHFVLPEDAKGKRIKIRFDGVYMNSSVYINGTFIGNRPYGFSTFEYDLTPYVKHDGAKNLIAVKVDNSLQPNCRWYTGSGINRNVHLSITEQQHFKSFSTFFRTTRIDGSIAHLKVDCEVLSQNYSESLQINFQAKPEEWKKVVKPAVIKVLLKDKEGNMVSHTSETRELGDFTTVKSSFEFEVKNPVLWSDKNPYLYTLELQLLIDGRVVNTEQQKVGIRMIEFNKDKGMLVNGQKVIVKGLCLHKDAASFGTAVPKDIWRYRLEKLKQLGCNAIRVHGPADPAFIDVCDEMGFYLMSESFDEWNHTWHYGRSEDPAGKLDYSYHLYFNQWAETDLKDMVRRDRNHPSVFMYSVGNEVPEQRYADGAKTLKKLMNWAKEEDDTRMITVGCDWPLWANANGFLDTMDVAGYNYPDRYFKEHYREQRAIFPNRILMGTENYVNLENWIAVRDNPYVVGLFLWVGIDYIGESINWPRRNWEWGLIDIGSFEKTTFYYWQAFWSERPMVHIGVELKTKDDFAWRCYDVASHWNFKTGEKNIVNIYSNTRKVELFQDGKSLGLQDVNPNTYKAVYQVDYKDGELTAKAYDENNKVVANHTIKTADKPAKLVLKNERTSSASDKDRLIILTLEVQDNNGTRCPFAKNEVNVDVSGSGELIGLDSGDPFSHELYKQNKRKAHEGRLLLTIRPKARGTITVKCKSDGLKPVTENFHAN